MRNYFRNACVFLSIFLFACDAKEDGAQLRLDAARSFYYGKEYVLAKQEIDSLKILYPKAFSQIKASLALLDTVRRAENMQIIQISDSLIALNEPTLDKFKKLFSYQRNKEYQETGVYIPKESVGGSVMTGTILRSGVNEDGILYLESVLVGSKQTHNQLTVYTKDGSFVESLPVTDDGLNFRFSNLGKDYEIIRFVGADENGVSKFIFSNIDKHLTVTLKGQGKKSYTLSQTIKFAISKSFQLSTMMLELDSLKTAKEKAEFHIYYLDNKKDKDLEDVLK